MNLPLATSWPRISAFMAAGMFAKCLKNHPALVRRNI
jgi:hypothetical protein